MRCQNLIPNVNILRSWLGTFSFTCTLLLTIIRVETLTKGPTYTAPIIGNSSTPYANNMQILLEIEQGNSNPFVEFLCEMITDAVVAAAVAAAPELAPADIMEEFEFTAMCGKLFGGE